MPNDIGAPVTARTTPLQPSPAPASPIVVASGLSASGLDALKRLLVATDRWSQ
jgi:hypothetical protein